MVALSGGRCRQMNKTLHSTDLLKDNGLIYREKRLKHNRLGFPVQSVYVTCVNYNP